MKKESFWKGKVKKSLFSIVLIGSLSLMLLFLGCAQEEKQPSTEAKPASPIVDNISEPSIVDNVSEPSSVDNVSEPSGVDNISEPTTDEIPKVPFQK